MNALRREASLKRAFILFAIAASACSGDSIPTPTPLPNTNSQSVTLSARGFVWILAVDSSGVCVDGATAEVIAGQRSGETKGQVTPCDAWSFVNGGVFWADLAPQETMTIRLSAPSRVSTDRTLTPQVGSITATVVELAQSK